MIRGSFPSATFAIPELVTVFGSRTPRFHYWYQMEGASSASIIHTTARIIAVDYVASGGLDLTDSPMDA